MSGRVDEAVSGFIDEGRLPGAVVLIARGGTLGHWAAYGKMGVDSDMPMRRDAVFRIYSMTKPVTTAVALMLHEEGRFAFDDPIARWLPALRHLRLVDGALAGRAITVRDLLCHTAGFSNTFGSDPVAALYRREKAGMGDLDRLVDLLGRLPLLHQPGERFHYSLATDVLGKLIELWQGATLQEVFTQRVFAPLGMTDSGFTVAGDVVDAGRLTTSHLRRPDGTLAVADAPETSTYRRPPERFAGASGLVSSALDYFRFGQMLLDGGVSPSRCRLLQPDSVRLMTTNQLPDSAMPAGALRPLPGLGFGMGVSVRVTAHQATDPGAPAGECGWGGAAGTHFWISPAHQLLVLTLRQTMPYETHLENVLKPVIYSGLKQGAASASAGRPPLRDI